jgi:hypothetical protein
MNSEPTFHYDAALTEQADDAFEFKELGNQLAHSVAGLLQRPAGGASFVVGLEGRWGSGKSTVMNYLKADLRNLARSEKTFFLDFDPWWLEEGANVAAELMLSILRAMPKSSVARSHAFLKRATSVASKLPPGLELIFSVSKKTEWIGGAIKKTREMGGDFDALLNSAKTPRQLRDEVGREFAEKGYRFVIFVDDLDRLTPDKALAVMSAVRSIADLPGCVYVFAYDAHALGNILESFTPPLGHDYFDKIVNISTTVPPVTYGQVERFLISLLDKPYREALEPELQQHRKAIIGLLDTPRGAVRLANTVNFWGGGKLSEVYLPDLITLEAIRLQSPQTYSGILRTSDVWLDVATPDPLTQMLGNDKGDEHRRQAAAARVDRELGLGSSDHDLALKQAISALFPEATAFLGASAGFDRSFSSVPGNKLRIGNRAHFYTYFLHRPLPGSATTDEVAALRDPRNSYAARRALVLEVASRPAGDVDPIPHLISLLEAEDEDRPVSFDVALELIRALSGWKPDPLDTSYEDGMTTTVDIIRGFAARFLKRQKKLTDPQVKALMDPANHLSILASTHLVLTIGTPHYLLDDKEQIAWVSANEGALKGATRVFVREIIKSIERGDIVTIPMAPRLLHMAHKHSPDRTQKALKPYFKGGEKLIALLETYVGFTNPRKSLMAFSGLTMDQITARVGERQASSRPPMIWLFSSYA